MRGLTLTQPWASLVAVGAKAYETRSWKTPYRGPIAIHAAKGFPTWAAETCWEEPYRSILEKHELVDFGAYISDLSDVSGERFSLMPRGVIVAVARLHEIHRTKDAETWCTEQEQAFGDYGAGRFAWALLDVVRLETPVVCKGSLGLWTVPPGIEETIREQIA